MSYQLTLPPGTTSVTLTPSVSFPAHATIRIDGVVVASGSASAPIVLSGFAPVPVTVSVVTDAGTTATYTLIVGRGSRYIKASNTNPHDYFGVLALSADGSTLAVGAHAEDSNATGAGGDQSNNSAADAGAVYVFTRAGATWSQQAYLKASNAGAGDGFGTSLALSADGSALAVGAPSEASTATGVGGDQTSNGAFGSGAVYVFTRSGTTWTQQAYIKASNTGGGDQFGFSVALSADGSTLAVGAKAEDSSATGVGGDQTSNGAVTSGSVYLFTRTSTTWTQQAYIKASNTGEFDRFGWSVALSADGSTLAVGAENEPSSATGIGGDQADNSSLGSGAVYVFTRSGMTWTQQAYIKASNTNSGDADWFGYSVALSADGSTLAVGAEFEDSGASGVGGNQADTSAAGAGAVYVFTRSGVTWTQQAYIKASNTDADDQFGARVALSADGSTLAVGAIGEDSNTTGIGVAQTNDVSKAGAVYVFIRTGSTWSQQAYVKASNPGLFDAFGTSVALSGDGSTLAVGASRERSNATGIDGNQSNNGATNAGAVYVF